MKEKMTALKHLKTAMSEVGGRLYEIVQAAARDVEALDESKADKGAGTSITIPTAGWAKDAAADYPNYYDLPVSGVTARDRADVYVAPAGLGIAAACGFCPSAETLAGKIRLRSARVPDKEIAAEYWIEKGKV